MGHNRIFGPVNLYLIRGYGRNLNTEQLYDDQQAGHSVRARPSLFPNLEVKPNVATVLLRCESPWEVVVLASFNQIIIQDYLVLFCANLLSVRRTIRK